DPLRLREPDPVDDAPMVQFVRQDGVAVARELRDEAGVPREAAHVEERGLTMLEPRNPPFEFLVQVHVSRNRTDAAASGPVGLHGLPGGPLHLGMVREVQVVARAEHDHALAVHHAARRRWTLEDAQVPIEALRDAVFVLCSNPGRRVAGEHRQRSRRQASLPHSPLRGPSIASATSPLSDFRTAWAPTVFASFIRYSFRWPMARTRPAPIERHTATAMRPIGPRPKMATVFPGTFAFVVV